MNWTTLQDVSGSTEILTGTAAEEAGDQVAAGGLAEDAGFARPGGGRAALAEQAEEAVAHAATLLKSLFESAANSPRGMRIRADVIEAFTSADFQWAPWIVLDRETIAQYQALESSADAYVDTTTVNDFRPKELVDFTQSGFTLEKIPELNPYPMQDRSGGFKQSISVAKYGRRYALSWEAMINDKLDELADLPAALAAAARDAEKFNALALLVNFTGTGVGSGPNTNFFKNYTGSWSSTTPFAGINTTPDNKPLTYDNLKAAIDILRARRDPKPTVTGQKRPIVLPGKFQLVVPVELQTAAEAIMAIDYREVTVGGVMTRVSNEVRNAVDLRVEPWLSYVDTHAKAPTTWYLLPPKGSNVKALMTAKLRGHENPELRVQSLTGNSLGGGAINPMDGSFAVDDIQYRVRHVLGGAPLNPIATYVSTGS